MCRTNTFVFFAFFLLFICKISWFTFLHKSMHESRSRVDDTSVSIFYFIYSFKIKFCILQQIHFFYKGFEDESVFTFNELAEYNLYLPKHNRWS